MEIVIFIESNTSGTGELFIKKVIEYGYTPVFLTSMPSLYSFIANTNIIKVKQLDTLQFSEIITCCNDFIKNGCDIKGIISTSEYYLQITAQVAEYYGLPGANWRAIEKCRNKFVQNQILEQENLYVPKTFLIEKMEELFECVKNMRFPLIVKPIQGSGSVGVKLCRDKNELQQHTNFLLQHTKNERGISVDNRVLVEEYIQGKEYSAEIFDGKFIGITQKHLGKVPFFVETGHDFPVTLEPNLQKTIEESILKAISALGLKWGACHVEFRIKDNKIYFIEINPRLAGGYIPEIVRKALGIDLIEAQLNSAINLKVDLKAKKNKKVGIRFIIPKEQGYLILKNEKDYIGSGILEIKFYKREGGLYEIRGDFRDRVGHIIFDENIVSEEKVKKICDEILLIQKSQS